MLGLSRTLPRGFHFPVLSFDAKIVPNALVTHSAGPTRWSQMAARLLRPVGGPCFEPVGRPLGTPRREHATVPTDSGK